MAFVCTVRGVGLQPGNVEEAKQFQPTINEVGNRIVTYFSSLKKPKGPDGFLFLPYFHELMRYNVAKSIVKSYKAELATGKNHGRVLETILSNLTVGFLLSWVAHGPDADYQLAALAGASAYLNAKVQCKNKRLVGVTKGDVGLITVGNKFYDLAMKRAGSFTRRQFAAINCNNKKRTISFNLAIALLNWARRQKVGYCGRGSGGGTVVTPGMAPTIGADTYGNKKKRR